MKSLEDAWNWFQSTRRHLLLMQRLAHRHTKKLTWEALDQDDQFKNLDWGTLHEQAKLSHQELDDLAVLVLFSVFEAMVRHHVELEVNAEANQIRHPTLQAASDEALRTIREGSFGRVLEPYKSLDSDLVEAVNQVRRYRNWVAHGKRDMPKAQVDPKTAYERLKQFLGLLKKPVGRSAKLRWEISSAPKDSS